jgi:hypothetical protein
MASFISTNEVLEIGRAGAISRNGAEVTTRLLNQAAGVAEGLLLAPSGTTGQECVSPSTAALVQSAIGFSAYRPMSEDFDATHHYSDNEAVSILRKGHMHVLCEGTCVADKPVFARITSDGGSNLILGKVRADSDVVAGGVVITPDASFAAVASSFTIVLDDGAGPESFTFTSDATPTTGEVAAGLVALIDASTRFAATGTVTISITSTTGIVEIVSIDERLPVTTPARAVRVPGCYFDASRTGAGLVEIRFAANN